MDYPIGLIIKQIIKEKRLSITDLASQVGISRQGIYKVYGRSSMSPEEIIKWAEALQVSPDELKRGVDVISNNKSVDNGAFGQEVIDRMLAEMKEQYEARIHELKETIGDLREQLRFNRDMMQVFKEGNLGKTEGATIDRFATVNVQFNYFFGLLEAK